MQEPPFENGPSADSLGNPAVRVHSENVSIAGDAYRRDTIYVGDEPARVEYPFAAFFKAREEKFPWLTLAVQLAGIAGTASLVAFLVDSLIS